MSRDSNGGARQPDTLETIGIIDETTLPEETRLGAAMAYCDAQSMPCDSESWMRFVRALWIAAYEATQGEHHDLLPENLGTIARYNDALMELIEANTWLKEMGLHQPIVQLQLAITDVARGNEPELFKPVVKRTRNKPLPSTAEDVVKGQAAHALDLLIQSGESASNAASQIARALKAGGVAGAARIDGRTIINWRNRHKQGAGADGVSVVSLSHFTGEVPAMAGQSPKEQAEWILRNLRGAPATKATKKSRQVPT
ncbi:MAG: hypothetical protein POG24_10205 [Acidocella sp.]|nr:hypothetical protein [Acidocella sp.]